VVTVFQQLAAAAETHPDQTFLRWDPPDRAQRAVHTYADEYRLACGAAAALRRAGARPGARVAVALPNGPDLIRIWFATAALGAVLVPLDPRLTEVELAALLRQAGIDLAVLRPEQAGLAAAGTRVLPLGTDTGGLRPGWAPAADQPPVRPCGDGRVPAAVLFTSGSTGRPKGCVISHDSLTVPAGPVAARLGITAADVLLHVLPLHHMAGLSFLATAVGSGATVALRPRFSGRRFWADAAASGATVFRHLGEMLAVLCQQSAAPPPHRLRLVYGGGASAAAARFAERFGVPAVEGYGLSETNTVLCGSPGPGGTSSAGLGTLGEPLPHVAIRLVEPGGGVLSGAGAGELQLHRNPALMLGYLAAPEATAAAFDGPWFRTGDMVRRDESGTLRFAGRLVEVIRRRGENIDPTEIERAVESCPGVRRAAVIAVPAPGTDGTDLGVEIQVFVQPDAGRAVSAAAVRARCAKVLAPFKQPRYVSVVDRLPLTGTHKVDKTALRALAAAGPVPAGPVPAGPVPAGPAPAGPVLAGPVAVGPGRSEAGR
jgi:acyl-CoA synthetase (AMP-forming)/AMP-acid ligase II